MVQNYLISIFFYKITEVQFPEEKVGGEVVKIQVLISTHCVGWVRYTQLGRTMSKKKLSRKHLKLVVSSTKINNVPLLRFWKIAEGSNFWYDLLRILKKLRLDLLKSLQFFPIWVSFQGHWRLKGQHRKRVGYPYSSLPLSPAHKHLHIYLDIDLRCLPRVFYLTIRLSLDEIYTPGELVFD